MKRVRTRLLAVLLGLVVPFAVLAAAEGVLRLFERHAGVFVSVPGPDGPLLTRERGSATLAAARSGPHDRIAFSARKQDGVYRIVVVGESTAAGFPYYPYLSFARVLEALLRDAATRPVEVINLGRAADYSGDVAAVACASLGFDADLLVVYCGHNEYQVPYCDALRAPPGWWESWLQDLRLLRGERAAERRSSLVSRAPQPPPGHRIGVQAFLTEAARSAGVERFRSHLLEIVETARRHHVPVVLATQASNLGTFPPSYSWFAQPKDDAARQRYEEELEAVAAALECGEPREPLAARCRALLAQDEGVALVHYVLAACLETTEPDAARREYHRALDLDGYPNRAGSAINAAIHELARSQDLTLVDVERELQEQAQRCVPGSDLFLDHCHPTVAATFLLGAAIFRDLTPLLQRAGVLPLELAAAPDFRDPTTVDRWLQDLGLDRAFLAARSLPAARLNLLSYLESPVSPEPLMLAALGFRCALAVEPELDEAHLGLAAIAVLQGDRAAALRESAPAATVDPEARAAFRLLCETHPALRAALAGLGLEVRGDGSLGLPATSASGALREPP